MTDYAQRRGRTVRAGFSPSMLDQPPRFRIVPDEACPRCGAYWGNSNDELNFPNRPKVDDAWKCYNPACTCAYYQDGAVLEDKLSPEDEAAMHKRIHDEVEAMMVGRVWITKGNTSQLHPEGQPLPPGWHLTGTHRGD